LFTIANARRDAKKPPTGFKAQSKSERGRRVQEESISPLKTSERGGFNKVYVEHTATLVLRVYLSTAAAAVALVHDVLLLLSPAPIRIITKFPSISNPQGSHLRVLLLHHLLLPQTDSKNGTLVVSS